LAPRCRTATGRKKEKKDFESGKIARELRQRTFPPAVQVRKKPRSKKTKNHSKQYSIEQPTFKNNPCGKAHFGGYLAVKRGKTYREGRKYQQKTDSEKLSNCSRQSL